MKTIIHIGTPKTGTSRLQSAFSAASERLAARGVLYPKTPRVSHNILEAAVKPPERLSREFKSKFRADPAAASREAQALIDDVHEQAQTGRYRTLVVSGEYLSTLSAAQADGLLELLPVDRRELQVVCYVRRPSDHWASMIQQSVKGSGACAPPAKHRYRFKQTLVSWRKAVGLERLRVRPYAREQLEAQDIVSDFAAHFLPEVDTTEAFGDLGARDNQSLPAEAAILLQRYHREIQTDANASFTAHSRAMMGAVLRASQEIDLTDFRVRPDLARLVDERHVRQLEWLREHFGVRLVDETDVSTRGGDGDGDGDGDAAPQPAAASGGTMEDFLASWDPERLQRLSYRVMRELAVHARSPGRQPDGEGASGP